MLSQEEYRAFEHSQRDKFQTVASAPYANYERWQVTRYDNNPGQYFVTARSELGFNFKQYVQRGKHQGGREIENRLFEELQYHYRKHTGVRITRSTLGANCQLYEVSQDYKPLRMIALVNGEQFLESKPRALKDGYRYRLQTQ
jgi:hypothetical protein